MSDLGQLQFGFDIDFGSFRDVQRHRNGVCRMPMLTTSRGFETWYLDQLDAATREKAVELLRVQEKAIANLKCSDTDRQYFVAMGFKVPVSITMGLPAFLYLAELRSTKSVHPTLRTKVLWMVDQFPEGVPGDQDAHRPRPRRLGRASRHSDDRAPRRKERMIDANHHDRWGHKNGNAQICVKCGDIASIDTLYDNYHANVPDTSCPSGILWTPEYERQQGYTKAPFWHETQIAAQEPVDAIHDDWYKLAQRSMQSGAHRLERLRA